MDVLDFGCMLAMLRAESTFTSARGRNRGDGFSIALPYPLSLYQILVNLFAQGKHAENAWKFPNDDCEDLLSSMNHVLIRMYGHLRWRVKEIELFEDEGCQNMLSSP